MKTCNRCDTSGLHWSLFEGRWRLYDDLNRLHVCASATRSPKTPMTAVERLLLGWRKEALELPMKALDCPPLPINYLDSWFDFLNEAPMRRRRQGEVFAEIVP